MRKKDSAEQNEKANPSQRILQTAYQCLSTRGYANVSMRDIATEAGVALSQLNYYFKSKEGLSTEVIKRMMQHYLVEVENKLNAVSGTKAKINAIVKYFNGLIQSDPGLLRLFFDLTAQSFWLPHFKEQMNGFINDLSDLIARRVLDKDEQNKTEKRVSPREVAHYILGVLYSNSLRTVLDLDGDKTPAGFQLADLAD